jgi:hypothetical protein
MITASRALALGPVVGGDRQLVRLSAARNWTATTTEITAEKTQRISRESVKERPSARFKPRIEEVNLLFGIVAQLNINGNG